MCKAFASISIQQFLKFHFFLENLEKLLYFSQNSRKFFIVRIYLSADTDVNYSVCLSYRLSTVSGGWSDTPPLIVFSEVTHTYGNAQIANVPHNIPFTSLKNNKTHITFQMKAGCLNCSNAPVVSR